MATKNLFKLIAKSDDYVNATKAAAAAAARDVLSKKHNNIISYQANEGRQRSSKRECTYECLSIYLFAYVQQFTKELVHIPRALSVNFAKR